jgi:DNA polymerase III subunit gamma/tau
MKQPDLKYRPKKFSDVLGNFGPKKTLLNLSLKNRLLENSLLFGGMRGCGKTTLARIVAKAVYCENLNYGEPCCVCKFCLSIEEASSESYLEFDAATQGTAEKIRAILDDLDLGTINSKPMILVLDEAQRLSPAAQDALLKSMEERKIFIIMCTTEPGKIRDSVKSRMWEFSISQPSSGELINWMRDISEKENFEFDIESLALISKMTEFCPRECVKALDILSLNEDFELDAVKNHFEFDCYESVANLVSNLDKPQTVLYEIESLSNSKSPNWVKDKLIFALMDAVKLKYDVPTKFPCKIAGSYDANLALNVASRLVVLDRPTFPEIEAVLIEPVAIQIPTVITQAVPVEKPKEHLSIVDVGKSESIPTVKNTPKIMTIDGISFSSNERLTSLDGKILKSEIAEEPIILNEQPFDNRHAPISEEDFKEAFK